MALVLTAALSVVACTDDPDIVLPPASTSTPSPAPADPATSDPATADPATSDPAPSGSALSDPATSDPAPSGSALSDPATSDPAAAIPVGYERVGATVTEPDGTVCELCLWLADDAGRRSQGLMFVTDLGDADGMAFVYPTLHTGHFWMKNTVLPLSIAFFGVEGTYLDAFDMEPCTEDPCPLYGTPDDFLVAIETVQGGLAELGIGPGSVLELTGLPCTDRG